MAADSGYYSFSASQSVHADDSSETSERSRSSELQESVDALRAVVGSGRAQILTARCNETITSISANLPTTFTPGKTKSFNRIHRFGKHNVSSRARSYSKITTCQRDDGVARIDKRTEPMPRPSNQIGLDDDTDDLSIATLMTSLCPERAVAKHFTVMINMMRHMNHALFDSESGREDQQHVMEEVKAMSREIIYFFDGVQKSFQDQVDKIEDTKDFLPLLGDNVEQHHLEAAIKIWAEKICESVTAYSSHRGNRALNRVAGIFRNLAEAKSDCWKPSPTFTTHMSTIHSLRFDVKIRSTPSASSWCTSTPSTTRSKVPLSSIARS